MELLQDTGAGINNADISLFLRRNYSLGLGGDERGNPVFVPQAFRVELPSHLLQGGKRAVVQMPQSLFLLRFR